MNNPNDFDPESFRLKQEHVEKMVQNKLTTIPGPADDGFGVTSFDNSRMFQGARVKFGTDGQYRVNDQVLPPLMELLLGSMATIAQNWHDKKLIDERRKPPEQSHAEFTDMIEALNEESDPDTWELNLSGEKRPPWQVYEVAYFIDLKTAQRFTLALATVGMRIAASEIRQMVSDMRAIKGQYIFPLVKLGTLSMKTRFGNKPRPRFEVVGWRAWQSDTPQLPGPKLEEVEKPTLSEEMEGDSIPF
jgi:hypothetical protein